MRYVEFRDRIGEELRRTPTGLTWAELKRRLKLPYNIPCPEWVKQMEHEIGLSRERISGRSFTWKVLPTMRQEKRKSLKEISGPIAEEFTRSGMTEDELSDFLETEKHAMRTERRKKRTG
jgi:hypothetical protein